MALTIKTTGIEDYLDGGEAYVKALVAGPPSAGKTRSASYWPKPIYADCEKGRMSLADRAMPYGEILSTDDMSTLLRNLQVECQKPVHARKYQTLVIDTIDAYQRIVIQERLTAERKEAFSGYGDWGYLDAKMTSLIAKLLALPMNIVVNMHVKEQQDGEDGPTRIVPKLKGDIREQIAAEFDLVGLMGMTWVAEGGERVLQRAIQWHPDPRVPWLKDRSGRLPKFTPVLFTDQDYTGLFTPLIGALDELSEGGEVEVMQGEADDTPPVPPSIGTSARAAAVAQPQPAPVKKVAAKKAAKAVPAATRPTMEIEGLPTAGAESAPAPAETPATTTVPEGEVVEQTGEIVEPTHEQAVQTVVENLGGTVIPTPDDDEPAAEPEVPTPAPAASPAPANVPTCGTPGKTPKGDLNSDPLPGCGKSLADENRDVINIGFIRSTRAGRPTYLCAACIAAAKAAS